MNADKPQIELVAAEGLIPKLEEILGIPLSEPSKHFIEASMLHVFQAATQTVVQTMFDMSLGHMKLSQELVSRVVRPGGIMPGMRMPESKPADAAAEAPAHG